MRVIFPSGGRKLDWEILTSKGRRLGEKVFPRGGGDKRRANFHIKRE